MAAVTSDDHRRRFVTRVVVTALAAMVVVALSIGPSRAAIVDGATSLSTVLFSFDDAGGQDAAIDEGDDEFVDDGSNDEPGVDDAPDNSEDIDPPTQTTPDADEPQIIPVVESAEDVDDDIWDLVAERLGPGVAHAADGPAGPALERAMANFAAAMERRDAAQQRAADNRDRAHDNREAAMSQRDAALANRDARAQQRQDRPGPR